LFCAIDRFKSGEDMKKTRLIAAMAVVISCAALASVAHAQTKPLGVWQPPQREEKDPAKRLPTMQPAPTTQDAPQTMVQPQSTDAVAEQYAAAPAPVSYEDERGGFFLGVQGGKGWVYEDVDQSALAVNAGYRWQAGPVTLVGIEFAAGKLDEADHDGLPYGAVDYTSVGANARFNFGRTSPVYGLVRGGYWAAEDNEFGVSADGGYFGLGIGVDINRHFNMSVVYTNHVYFNDDYYGDVNSAETLMLGAEVRF
jgi:hypothetical protein